jgi:hypothetical protein
VIVGVVGFCAGLYVLDFFLLTPWLDSLNRMSVDRGRIESQLADARRTLTAGRTSDRKWREVKSGGFPADPSATESTLLNAIRGWASESGLTLVSLRPDRAISSKGLSELSFQATGSGSMRSITSFLYKIETATMPIRVHEVQIAVKTEAVDDLTVQLHLSSLWEEVKPGAASTVAASGAGGQP